MRKKVMDIIIIIIISFIFVFLLTNTCNAVDPIDNPDYYMPGDGEDSERLRNMAGIILGAVQVIGTVISVITLMIIGIKYMCGSVEERAEYKQVMVPWLIGAVLVFSATTIPNILYNLNLFGS